MSDVDDQLKRLLSVEQRLSASGDFSPTSIEYVEACKSLAATGLMICCSSYEVAVYDIAEKICDEIHVPGGVRNYLSDIDNRLFSSAHPDNLYKHLERFNKAVSRDFKKRLDRKEVDALKGMYSQRNRIAHRRGYDTLDITLSDVIAWHKIAKGFFRKYETRLRRAIR